MLPLVRLFLNIWDGKAHISVCRSLLCLVEVDAAREVAVATLDGRAYFFISNLLKSMGLPFRSLTPYEPLDKNVKVVISTRKERAHIPFESVLCLEDLDSELAVAKILYMLKKPSGDDVYVIGIDPGVRIGISAFYLGEEVYKCVVYSPAKALSIVSKLLKGTPAKRKVVRVGDGNIDIALKLVKGILDEFGRQIQVEIVDEAGTTSLVKSKPNKRSVKDLRSARLIALRQGREVTSSILESYGK